MAKQKSTQKFSRLTIPLPRVGIRPVIDARFGGVRESLERQTMDMATVAATLISTSLRHANGEPVECVIGETCIGGAAEAARVATQFERKGVKVSLTVTPCWCYGAETMDIDPLSPKAIWGFNGTERPGAVYLAAVLAAHNQKGLPAFGIYGRNVQDAEDTTIPPDVAEKILRFVKAALSVTTMRGTSYLSIGSVSMGIAGSIVSDSFFSNYLGLRCEYVDMSEVKRRLEFGIYDTTEFGRAMKWVHKYCTQGADENPPSHRRSNAQKRSDWETSVKMAMIVRDMMVGNPALANAGFVEEALGHNALAAGFQGQRHWTDFMPNGDFAEAILNSSFDWNGTRQPFIVATENDSLNAATMLMAHLLDGRAQIFADVRTYWSPEALRRISGKNLKCPAELGFIHLVNSGAAALDGCGCQRLGDVPVIKPWWEVTPVDVIACLKATKWAPAMLEYFRGGGYSSSFTSKGGMPLTMSRINLIAGLGPVLQIAEGYSIDLPAEIAHLISRRTNPTWPNTWFVPRLEGSVPFRDVYSVMAHWGANHCTVSYGHIGADLITLASMLRIPVSLHNVPPERIFRPSAWSAFGAHDPHGADFRACGAYGPLYGRMDD